MIRKAQVKFVITFMSILLFVFIALYACIYSIMRVQNTVYIDKEITNIYTVYQDYGTNSLLKNEKLILIDGETRIYDNNFFNSTKVDYIYKYAKENKVNFGNNDTIYYKFFQTERGSLVFIAADKTENILEIKRGAINLIWPMLLMYLISFVLVWVLSFRTLDPIKDTFIKQRRFIADASHELKTPTTIISANAEVLKEIHDSQWVENIKSQTERLNVLIADMLDLAKMDEGKFKLSKEHFNLSEIVMDIALSFDAVAYEKKKELIIDVAPSITANGDSTCIKKIITILLDNAIKHSSDNGQIKVTLTSNGENKATLSVFNTGSCIPNDQANKVFERFYRGENSRNPEYGGSGLGLSIAQGLAKANKWKLTAVSKLYESMEFILII